MRSAKEFWNDARNELGYDCAFDLYEHKELNYDLPGWDVHHMHEYACDDLSRRIAVETGQAKEIAPGVIQLKHAHIYYVGGERHAAIVGDRWNPEICR